MVPASPFVNHPQKLLDPGEVIPIVRALGDDELRAFLSLPMALRNR